MFYCTWSIYIAQRFDRKQKSIFVINAVFSITNFDLHDTIIGFRNYCQLKLPSGWNIRTAELNKRSIATLDGSRKSGDYSCKFTTH